MQPPTASTLPLRCPATPGGWFALATLVAVGVVFIYNNLAGYVGLHHAGAMTMYSGLTPDKDNHFLVPKGTWADGGTYVAIERVGTRNLGTPPARMFQALEAWTKEENYLVSLNLVRYHVSRTCRSAQYATIRLTLRTEKRQVLDWDNVCTDPAMLDYVLLSSFPICYPNTCDHLRKFVRASVPAG